MASDMNDRHFSLDNNQSPSKEPLSPKRKASESTENGTESSKKKRRKVNHACVYCRRSHMTCDLQRPCARCIKRDIGHLCHDEPRDPPKRSKSEVGVAEIAPAPEGGEVKSEEPTANGNGHGDGDGNGSAQYQSHADGEMKFAPSDNAPQLAQPQPVSPTRQMQRPTQPQAMNPNSSNPTSNFDWNNSGLQNQFQDMHHLHPNYMFNNSEVTNEYNLLNDFLSNSLLDDGAMYSNEDAQAFLSDPLLATSSMAALTQNLQPGQGPQPSQQAQRQQQPPPLPMPPPATTEIPRPPSTYPVDTRARDKFYMTAADPAGLSSPSDRLHKLLRAKYDAGMLRPFNYVKGYAKLNTYMEKSGNISRESRVRILRQLERFRPKFREAMQSLTDMQLVLVEMWFERSLMEYDRVFASMAIPACCWRRTGEIFRGNREMAELINVPTDMLRDGKLAIHEIIAEDSLVSYWEKFGAIAFDQSQKAILTSCSLKSPGDEVEGRGGEGKSTGGLRCCFSFTIRRDTHNM